MPRQEFIPKAKQGKLIARDPFKTDISNMPELEFKMTIIRNLAWLEKSIEDTRQSFTAEIKDLKLIRPKQKTAITEQQNSVDVMTTRREAEQ